MFLISVGVVCSFSSNGGGRGYVCLIVSVMMFVQFLCSSVSSGRARQAFAMVCASVSAFCVLVGTMSSTREGIFGRLFLSFLASRHRELSRVVVLCMSVYLS